MLLQDPLLNEEEEEDEEAAEKPQRAVCSAKMLNLFQMLSNWYKSAVVLNMGDVFRRGKLHAPAKRR